MTHTLKPSLKVVGKFPNPSQWRRTSTLRRLRRLYGVIFIQTLPNWRPWNNSKIAGVSRAPGFPQYCLNRLANPGWRTYQTSRKMESKSLPSWNKYRGRRKSLDCKKLTLSNLNSVKNHGKGRWDWMSSCADLPLKTTPVLRHCKNCSRNSFWHKFRGCILRAINTKKSINWHSKTDKNRMVIIQILPWSQMARASWEPFLSWLS